jgi:hypothetical protein
MLHCVYILYMYSPEEIYPHSYELLLTFGSLVELHDVRLVYEVAYYFSITTRRRKGDAEKLRTL